MTTTSGARPRAVSPRTAIAACVAAARAPVSMLHSSGTASSPCGATAAMTRLTRSRARSASAALGLVRDLVRTRREVEDLLRECLRHELHDVLLAEDADALAARLRERVRPVATALHQAQSVLDGRVAGQRVGPRRHEPVDARVHVHTPGKDLQHHIALGQDAEEALPVADEECLAAIALHPLDGVADRRLGSHDRRLAAPDGLQLLAAQLATGERLGRVTGSLLIGHRDRLCHAGPPDRRPRAALRSGTGDRPSWRRTLRP